MDKTVNPSVLARRVARSPRTQQALRSFSHAGTKWLIDNADDDGSLFDSGSLMVIAPHPDDESLGCGGTIARKTALGLPVTIVVVTDGRNSHESAVMSAPALAELRAGELHDAASALGVDADSVQMLGFEDGQVPANLADVTRQLVKLIEEVEPDQLLIPSRIDAHRDHRAIHDAAQAALAEARQAGRSLSCQVLSYLIWFWKPEAWVDADASVPMMCLQLLQRPVKFVRRVKRTRAVVAVDIEPFRETKREAVNAHRSQTTNITNEPTWRTIPAEVCEDFISTHEVFLTF